MKLYHNPRCSKSREALKLLAGQAVEIVDYLNNPLSVEELRDLCTLLGMRPTELLRQGEPEYKQLTTPSDEEALELMHKYPKLMQRPIFINGARAIIGRPPEKVLDIL